jgi:hypothetical protein
MKVEEIKKLMQAIDELETQFAQQKADYEAERGFPGCPISHGTGDGR